MKHGLDSSLSDAKANIWLTNIFKLYYSKNYVAYTIEVREKILDIMYNNAYLGGNVVPEAQLTNVAFAFFIAHKSVKHIKHKPPLKVLL